MFFVNLSNFDQDRENCNTPPHLIHFAELSNTATIKTHTVYLELKSMAVAFNLFFDSKLDPKGGDPTIKKKSLDKLIELVELSFSVDLTTCPFRMFFKKS